MVKHDIAVLLLPKFGKDQKWPSTRILYTKTKEEEEASWSID